MNKKDPHTDNVSFSTIKCPECDAKGCGFCKDKGLIHFTLQAMHMIILK